MPLLDDPLRQTLMLLPVSAALAFIATRSLGARIARLEIALWVAWLLLALHSPRLALASSAELVFAGGAILAAIRVALLVPLLARTKPDRRRAAAAFLMALAFLLFLWPWSRAGRAPDGDEPYYLLLTESLARDFDVDLADEYRDRAWAAFSPVPIAPQPGDPVGPDGEQWSRHTAFLPLLLAPLYRAAGMAGAELGLLLLAAALAAAIFATAAIAEGSRAAARVWALVVLAPPLFVYAGRFWVEVPAALAVALALVALARLEREPGALDRRAILLLGGALAALPLLKLRFLALALPLLLVALFRLRHRRHAARRPSMAVGLVGALAVLLGAVALWNFARFGNPLRMYDGGELDPTAISPGALGRGLEGLAFDAAYGLVATSPVWLLLAPAALFARRRPLALAALAAALPYLYFVAGRREWYGGWSPPFRYGIVLLPILALLLAPLLARRRPAGVRAALVATLSAATAVLGLVALLHPAWTFSLADGASRPLAELSRIHVGDLVRFTPSAVRPRLATWLWLLAIPLAIVPFLRRVRPARSARARAGAPALAGVVALLFAFAGWLFAAQRVPTRIVEVEDSWVDKRGGGLFPGPWTIDRTRYAGGWNLATGQELSFAPVAGGETAAIELFATRYGEAASPVALELRVGERVVGRFEDPEASAEGRTFRIPPETLAPGERIAVRAVRPPEQASAADTPGASHWVVDRLRLDWSPAGERRDR